MILKKISTLTVIAVASTVLFVNACKSDDDDDTVTAAATTPPPEAAPTVAALPDSTNPGAAITEISSAMGSLALILPTGLRLEAIGGDYCNAKGDPITSGTEVDGSAATYAPAVGYCQTTFNSLSPDTPRGAMYLAGGIACEVGVANLLDGLAAEASKTETITIDFGTDCWGSQAEADAFKADTGSDSLDLAVTVNRLASTADFDYKINFAAGEGQDIELLTKSGDGIRAARFTETTSEGNTAFAVTLDASDLDAAKISFEKLSLNHESRSRVVITGKLDSDLKFSSVDSVKGFDLRGQEDGDAVSLVTFSGDTTKGFIGASYSPVRESDGTGSCYLPGSSTATCEGLTVISSSLTEAEALDTGASAAQVALSAYDKILDLTDADPSVVDVTK
jgi:hypothetical protein